MMEEYKNQESAKQDEYTQPHPRDIVSLPASVNTSSSEETFAEAPVALPTAAKDRKIDSAYLDTLTPPDIHHQDHQLVKETAEKPDVIDLQLSLLPNLPDTASYDITVNELSQETTYSPTTKPSPEPESPSGLKLNVTSSPETNRSSDITETNTVGSTSSTTDRPEVPTGNSASVNPTTQESVYKTITKRLSLLEANATLSLRYIEEQSQLLRDVFGKMERRHGQKMDSFLSEMNATLSAQLEYFVYYPADCITD
jgi:hypothetical protein